MNKTVNINLAGIFFHIDEDAYLKLQRYLEAIKRSFTDSQGRSEIIADIESRISELFTERVKHDKQVIGNKEVDEVISIMGQPEDYLVDDEIFEDEPTANTRRTAANSRKLYRDTDNSYVGGVASGLAHYFGLDVFWIRLIWLILFLTAGTGFVLYIILWILIPEATSTSEKLMMTGEKVTISNIEKKIRDGFGSASENVGANLQKAGDTLKEGFENASNNISETVKKIDVNKQGNRIKSGSKSFFDTLSDIVMFFFKIFGKFIGLILAITGIVTIIGLIIGLISANFLDRIHFPGTHFNTLSELTGDSTWVIALLIFFMIAIPVFMLFYLGLRILIPNLKSLGNPAKFSLFGVWLLSIIGLGVLSAKQSLDYSERSAEIKTMPLENIAKNDTLVLTMQANDFYAERFNRHYGFEAAHDVNGKEILYSQGVRLIVKSTRDSIAKIRIDKSARGSSFSGAKSRAQSINYNYTLENNILSLDNNFTMPKNEKYRDQEVEVTVYLPEGTILYADENTYNFHSNSSSYYNDILDHGLEEHYLLVEKNKLKCLDCTDDNEEDEDSFKVKVDLDNSTSKLKIDDDGLEAKTENLELKVNDEGVKASTKNVKVTINDEEGINVSSKKDQE